MADHNDAALLVQLAQWATAMGYEEAAQAVFADDFDPESASTQDSHVGRLLNFGETISTLVKHDLLDRELVLDWLWLPGLWTRVGPAAQKLRQELGEPGIYENFEALVSS